MATPICTTRVQIRTCTSRFHCGVCVCISKKQRGLSYSRTTASTSTETWLEPFSLEAPSHLENRTYDKSSRNTWCGGEMSSSNAMLLCFTSGVPYGFRDRQRFELVPKMTCCKKMCKQSSQQSDQSCFARIREQHTRGRTSLTGLARRRQK